MTQALYRRYRPETFADVIGQEHVTDPLRRALRSGRVNHAYLFSGPRGCGKTTSARILARCLNCEQGPTDTPCGTCESCVALARGGPGSVDVIEIDAASHGGVDDARDLREKAAYGPARFRYRIYIIDEAHMVTPQGFNALLKIVEEPPEHVKFVFATTEPEKVIGTIRSRTHHYPFRLVPPARLQDYLAELCERESVPVEAGVLSFVVRAGGGSVRDSLSVLDQLMAGADEGGLTYAGAAALLGFTSTELLDATVEALGAHDGGSVFTQVDKVIESGQDPRRFLEDLLERLRDLIIVLALDDGAATVLRGTPTDQLDRMRLQAAAFGRGELSRAADIVNQGLTEMTGATSPRLQLELVCARLLLPGAAGEQGYGARLDRLERRLTLAPGAPIAAPAPGGQPGGAERTPTEQAAAGHVAAGHVAPGQETVGRGDAGPGAGSGSGQGAGSGVASGSGPDAGARADHGPSGPADPHAAGPQPGETTPRTEGQPGAPTAPSARAGRPPADPSRPAWQTGDPVPSAFPGAGDGARRPTQGLADPQTPSWSGGGAAGADGDRQRDAGAAAGRETGYGADRAGQQGSGPASTAPAAAGHDGPAGGSAGGPGGGSGAPGSLDTDAVRRAWPDILGRVFREKRATWTLLSEHAQVVSFDGQRLVLGIATPGITATFRNSRVHAEIVRQALIDELAIDAVVEGVPMSEAGGQGSGGGSSGPQGGAPAGGVPAAGAAYGAQAGSAGGGSPAGGYPGGDSTLAGGPSPAGAAGSGQPGQPSEGAGPGDADRGDAVRGDADRGNAVLGDADRGGRGPGAGAGGSGARGGDAAGLSAMGAVASHSTAIAWGGDSGPGPAWAQPTGAGGSDAGSSTAGAGAAAHASPGAPGAGGPAGGGSAGGGSAGGGSAGGGPGSGGPGGGGGQASGGPAWPGARGGGSAEPSGPRGGGGGAAYEPRDEDEPVDDESVPPDPRQTNSGPGAYERALRSVGREAGNEPTGPVVDDTAVSVDDDAAVDAGDVGPAVVTKVLGGVIVADQRD